MLNWTVLQYHQPSLISTLQNFVLAYANGKLVKPEDCGHVIAALSLKAPKTLSGQFVSWDSEECREFRSVE